MNTNSELWSRRVVAVARGVASMHPVFADRASNAEVWDAEGKRYIDFAGGIAVLNTGHCHPKVIRAVMDQLRRFTHTAFQVMPYEPYIALAERLNGLAPGDHPKKALLMTTGAEAVENAVKIARAHTKRAAVIAFSGAFHGRTLMTLALTGKVSPYKVGFGPFPAEVYHAPFPSELHGVGVDQSLDALQLLFKTDVEPQRVAAVIVEPVQGEGGFYIAPADFLRRLRKTCDDHGIVFVADEIQSGFGRTGKMFAVEHSGVVPDLITVAKSLAGGFPLSAVIGRADIMDAVGPGGLGGTYGGSPIACAAALAVIDVIQSENLLERSRRIGDHVKRRLQALADKISLIGEVRGVGAMVAFELFKDSGRREPHPELAAKLLASALKRGLILLSCGIYANVIRILVPLTAPDEQIDEGLRIIEQSLQELVAA
jgi:4-aminobutyrate aminotransferase/(S)-3-amino-2-methylpropionate transaminase